MTTALISVDQLRKLCQLLPEAELAPVAEAINKVCVLYDMNTDILHEFLANVLHESREFTVYEEDLNYSAKRLLQVWPNRFKTIGQAQLYAHQPKRLANYVYGGRLGNYLPDDGWNFRGSGPIQMTGRSHFVHFAGYMKSRFSIDKQVQEWVDLIRINHEYALHSACYVFSVAKGLNSIAVVDDIRLIIKKINGAIHGNNGRLKYYHTCKKNLHE